MSTRSPAAKKADRTARSFTDSSTLHCDIDRGSQTLNEVP